MPLAHPPPSPEQRQLLDDLHDAVARRNRLTRLIHTQVEACADAGITPAQVARFTGMAKQTARQAMVRYQKRIASADDARPGAHDRT